LGALSPEFDALYADSGRPKARPQGITGRSARDKESPARAEGEGGTGFGPVSGGVLRSERAAFFTRSCVRTSDRVELHVGEAGLASCGLGERKARSGVDRKRRVRRPLPGMMLHIDVSHHQWFQEQHWHHLM